jgi:hypothetical protein
VKGIPMLTKTVFFLILSINLVQAASTSEQSLKYQTSPAMPISGSPRQERRRPEIDTTITYEFLERDRLHDQSKERALITHIFNGDTKGMRSLLNRHANIFDLIFMRINQQSQRYCAYTIAFTVYQGENKEEIQALLAQWIDKNIGIVKNSIFNTMRDNDLLIFESLINECAILYYDHHTCTDYFGTIKNRLAKAKLEHMTNAELIEAGDELRTLSAENPILFSALTKRFAALTSTSLTSIQSCSELPGLDSPSTFIHS